MDSVTQEVSPMFKDVTYISRTNGIPYSGEDNGPDSIQGVADAPFIFDSGPSPYGIEGNKVIELVNENYDDLAAHYPHFLDDCEVIYGLQFIE